MKNSLLSSRGSPVECALAGPQLYVRNCRASKPRTAYERTLADAHAPSTNADSARMEQRWIIGRRFMAVSSASPDRRHDGRVDRPWKALQHARGRFVDDRCQARP